MTTSEGLLRLLDALHRAEVLPEYLLDHLEDMIADDPPYPTPAERAEAERLDVQIRSLIEELVRRRKEPGRYPANAYLDASALPDLDDLLDEHFTRQLLANIPDITNRWKLLRSLSLVLLPGDRTTSALREALNCYLYGLPNAAVALCRSVLEFALLEKLGSLGGVQPDRPNLDGLINYFEKLKMLTGKGLSVANRIRSRGNNAIHRKGCSEDDALDQIRDTAVILGFLYGTPR